MKRKNNGNSAPAKRPKAEGVEKGGPGIDFQVQLTMFFARQGYELSLKQPNYYFEIGKERLEAGKFDDIVFRYKENRESKWNYLLLQSKYKESKITARMLLAPDNNDSFALIKYFSSYIKTKEDFSKETDSNGIETCVIVTNADFQYDQSIDEPSEPTVVETGNAETEKRGTSYYVGKFIFEECSNLVSGNRLESNQILTVHGTQAKYLKFHKDYKKDMVEELKKQFELNYNNTREKETEMRKHTNKEIVEYLKDLISDDDKFTKSLSDFLDKLLFIVNLPDREAMRNIIKDKIGDEFLLLNDSIVDQFNREMHDYTINKFRKEFLTGEDIKSFFNKMKQVINTLNLKTDYFLKIQNSVRVVDFNAEIKRKIDFVDFISSPESDTKDILLLKTDSTFLTALKIYRMLQETCLTRYTYSDTHVFLSLEEFNSNTWNAKVISSFRHENGINLLVIVFADQPSTDTQNLLKSLCTAVDSKKRLVLITPKGSKLDNGNDETLNARINSIEDNNINFCDLTDSSKESLLSTPVKFQGHDLMLRQLFCEAGKQVLSEQIKQVNIGTQTFNDIAESCLIEVKKPLNLSELEGSYTKFYEEMKIEILVENLISSDNIFIISGISKDTLVNVMNSFISNNHEEKINNIEGKFSDGKIIIRSENFSEENFKEICHQDPVKEIYWIEYERNAFILRHYYNPKFYLDRKFYYPEKVIINHNIKKELLQDNPSSLFLFTGIEIVDNLLEILELDDHQTEALQKNIRNNKITILKEDEGAKFIKLKKDNNKTVHWLHVEDEKGTKQIVWLESHGSFTNLLDSTEVKEIMIYSDEQLIDKIKDKKSALIIDKPGMGKSTTLVSVSQKLLASYWIMNINLRDCKKAIENLPMDVNNVDIALNFLSETKKIETSLEKDLARFKLEHDGGEKPLKILFDGFDEIKSDNADNREKTKVISLLKFLTEHTKATLWVTARQHDALVLQDSLSVFCIKFEAFTPLMQKHYFRDAWKKYLKMCFSEKELNKVFSPFSEGQCSKFEEYYMTLSEMIHKILQVKDSNFMGIPLTLRLFSESYREKFKKFVNDGLDFLSDFDDLSIFTLYQHFIDEKFEIFLKEKTKLSEGFNKISKDWFKEQIIKKHQRLAFQELFSDRLTVKLLGIKSPFLVEEQSLMINEAELEELLRLGLVQSIRNDHFEFIHRTFSEYFVAKLFAYVLKNKNRNNPDKYNQMYDFIDKEIFKEQHTVIFKFLDSMAHKEKHHDWTIKWELILSIRKNNLLGTETEENVIIWNAQSSSQESLGNLKRQVEMFLESFRDEGSRTYQKDRAVFVCELIQKLFQKLLKETDVDELKRALELWFKVSNRISNVNNAVNVNMFYAIQHYVTQAEQQNIQPELEFIKKQLQSLKHRFHSNDLQIIEQCNKKYIKIKEDLIDLNDKDLIRKVNAIYRNKNCRWLERDGIEIVVSLKLLTMEMSKNLNSFIENEQKPDGGNDVYASRMYEYLVLPLLNFISYNENIKNANIEISAFLNIFQCITKFCSHRSTSLKLSETELKSLLNCVQNVMQFENVSPQNLFYGIDTLRALRTWNFRLTSRNDNLHLTNGNEFVHKLTLNYDVTKMESLLVFRLKNEENDAFLEECKKVYTSIKEAEF